VLDSVSEIAAGNIAAEGVARSAPDGYTVLQLSQALVANASLYRNLPYDLVRDFAPVTMLAIEPYIVVVHPSLPVKSIKELIALARAKPGQLTFSSPGQGSLAHVGVELLKVSGQVDMVHVPYRGSALAFPDIISDKVQLIFDNLPGAQMKAKYGFSPDAKWLATRVRDRTLGQPNRSRRHGVRRRRGVLHAS